MDPLLIFSPEVVDLIWSYLTPQQLLSVRAVSSKWLLSVSNSPGVWVTEFSKDWHEYLQVRKMVKMWTSNDVRMERIENVRGIVFAETAFYLLNDEGWLSMFNAEGELVRIFYVQIQNFYRGLGGLLLNVERRIKTENGDASTEIDTFVTDGVMNVVDVFHGVKTKSAFSNGFVYSQDNKWFLNVGDVKIQTDSDFVKNADFHILTECAVAVCGQIDIIVNYIGTDTRRFSELRTYKSSPLVLPDVKINEGPSNYFVIVAGLGAFTKVSVFDKNDLVFESYYDNLRTIPFFTEDIFVTYSGSELQLFAIGEFHKTWVIELNGRSIEQLIADPSSVFKNCIVVLDNEFSIFVYGINGKRCHRIAEHKGGLNRLLKRNVFHGCTSNYFYQVYRNSTSGYFYADLFYVGKVNI